MKMKMEYKDNMAGK